MYVINLPAGALGDKEDGGEKAGEVGEDPEVTEARREMEEKRKEKHRKMEAEREEMRQGIRDKVFTFKETNKSHFKYCLENLSYIYIYSCLPFSEY